MISKTQQRRENRRLLKVIHTNIEARQRRVGELYCEGKTQTEISKMLEEEGFGKASQPTVSLDLAAIRERWRENATMNFDQRLQMELARLDRLEALAMTAYERSCEDAVEVTVTKAPPRLNIQLKSGDTLKKKQDKKPKVISEIVKTKGQSGNPAFLAEARACVEKRCKLLGLLDERAVNVNQNVQQVDLNQLLGRKSDPNIQELRKPVIEDHEDPIEDELKKLEERANSNPLPTT